MGQDGILENGEKRLVYAGLGGIRKLLLLQKAELFSQESLSPYLISSYLSPLEIIDTVKTCQGTSMESKTQLLTLFMEFLKTSWEGTGSVWFLT